MMDACLNFARPPQTSPLPVNILSVHNLTKSFIVDGDQVFVLRQLDFTVNRGELICIVGPSGCGKTTLLNILAGFTPSTAGSVLLNGRPVAKPGPDRCVVFQEDALFPWLTVEENIAFGLRGARRKVRENVARIIEMVGLTDVRNYLPTAISGGMKQRVALARVLILKPEVLLMDEPFGALDAQARSEMQNLLLRFWERLSQTILFVTHDMQEAVKLADRVLIIGKKKGQITDDMPIDLPRPREERSHLLTLSRVLVEKLRS
ncbi:putative ATP-binding protein BAB2_1147 [Desulfosarcina cetonica]|nr:putative ATP-binding protein BAB2_1147 [Desulfosarcina cetonica]